MVPLNRGWGRTLFHESTRSNYSVLADIASGGSDDWALGVGNSEYAYTIELRDQGRYGFQLPESQIIESGIETYEGFKVVARFVRDNPSAK